MRHLFCIITFSFMFCLQAFGQFQETYLIRLPQGNVSCDQQAAELKDRYLLARPQAVIQSRCVGDFVIRDKNKDYHFNSVEIYYEIAWTDYTSRITPHVYSHAIDGMRSVRRAQGMYSDLGLCLKELPKRVDEFRRYVNANVFAATCERGESSTPVSFTARIDTIGKTETDIYSEQGLAEQYQVAPFKGAIERMIKNENGVIVDQRDSFFYYYGKDPIDVHTGNFGRMSARECQSQIHEVESLMAQEELKSFVVGCLKSEVNPKNPLSLEGVWNGFPNFSYQTVNEAYSRFEDCMSDKTRYYEDAKRRGTKLKAGICHLNFYSIGSDNPTYELELYN